MIEVKINKSDLEKLLNENNLNLNEVKITLTDDKKIDYRSIKTFEDACNKLSLNPVNIIDSFNNFPNQHKKHLIAHYKLVIIFEAINDGWIPDYSNDKEEKYYPWFKWNKSSGFSFNVSFYDCSDSNVGSLLSTNTKEKSDYIGKQFIDIYNDFLIK